MVAPSSPEPALLHWAWDLPRGGSWPWDMGDSPRTCHTCHCRRPRPQQAGHICRQRSPPVGRGTGVLSGWVGGPAPLPDQQAARPALVVHHCLLTEGVGVGFCPHPSAHTPKVFFTPYHHQSLLHTPSFTHSHLHSLLHTPLFKASLYHSLFTLIFPSHPSFPHTPLFTSSLSSFIPSFIHHHSLSFTP